MQGYNGLNPFLQSVNSPINQKSFLPVGENYPVPNSTTNPPPVVNINGAPDYSPFMNAFLTSFIQAPNPIDFSTIYPNNFIGSALLSQPIRDMLGVGDAHIHVTANGTTEFTSTDQTDPGTTVLSADFSFSGPVTYLSLLSCKAKYTAFDTEGSTSFLSFWDNEITVGTFPFYQASIAGHWAGTVSDFEQVTTFFMHQSNTDEDGAVALRGALRIPSGGSGTAIIKDVHLETLVFRGFSFV